MLVVDNGSSYTGDLTALLDGLGCPYRRVIPSDLAGALDTLPTYDGIILSGRKRNDRTMNMTNSKVIRYAAESDTKLLGICYGAEIMALALGGTVRRSDSPQKNTHISVNVTKDTPISPAGLISVFESHRYEVSRLPPPLEAVGSSETCRYEIIRHAGKKMYGAQFHPEMSRDGRAMIERFCRL